MIATEQGDSFLMSRFREFYHEVIRQKRLIQSGLIGAPQEKNAEEEDSDRPLSSVWRKLVALLEQQSASVSRVGGEYVLELYKEAQFVMAALADEIFLQLNWEGKETWHGNLLETKLFDTHAAGDIFFQKLDRILQHRDPIYSELAKVYLMALALGFQGKYRGSADEDRLDFYRRELFVFIFHREPDILSDANHFCSQAYAHNLEEGTGLKLPNPRKWILISILFTAGLVAASHGIWVNLIEDLEQVIQQILTEA